MYNICRTRVFSGMVPIMIEIVIPLSQILDVIPIEIIFSIFLMVIGASLIFIFESDLQLDILGALCICMGLICLLQYILGFMIISSMSPIPRSFMNITFPISVKVV